LALVGLLLVFWSGFLSFPLSDFPALAIALLAIVSVSRPFAVRWMLLAGISCAAAIDMRPSYLALVPVVLVLAVWGWFDRRGDQSPGVFRRVLCLSALFVGFAIVSLPQSLSAHRHYKTWSFIPGAAAHLESLQLTEGLILELYWTYIGKGHGPQMGFVNAAGLHIVNGLPKETVTGTTEYLGLIFDHPLTLANLFAVHLINGLDPRYTTPYPTSLSTHWWLRIAGFLLVFLALVRVLWPRARRSLGNARWRYPIGLLLCCVTSVPAAVETRYLLPLYVLSYILVLAPGWPSPVSAGQLGLRRYRTLGAIAVLYVIFMLIVWHVTGTTSDHRQFR
jgi:hypothetical protein